MTTSFPWVYPTQYKQEVLVLLGLLLHMKSKEVPKESVL